MFTRSRRVDAETFRGRPFEGLISWCAASYVQSEVFVDFDFALFSSCKARLFGVFKSISIIFARNLGGRD